MTIQGKWLEHPIEMRRGQVLSIICDRDGKFVRVEEIAPPILNYRRLPMPSFHDEIELRTREWADLERTAYEP